MRNQRASLVGRSFAVVGDITTILATAAETEGRFSLFEVVIAPGQGPPPHTHTHEHEWFYVLDGEIEFGVGDQRRTATSGVFLSGPRDVPHYFRNVGAGRARMLVLASPPGLEGFFAEVGQPVASNREEIPALTAEQLARVSIGAVKFGIRIAGVRDGAPLP
jgi:quercetin dioxygenase-like cupin family protein